MPHGNPLPPIEALEPFISERFVRSDGPGGQNVNKVATAVQLSFALNEAPLPVYVWKKLKETARGRINADGMLVIDSRTHRTREKNRTAARERLMALIKAAAVRPKKRIATKPTRASKRRRVESKKKTGDKKRMRQKPKNYE